ncbi:MAG: xanthine dehydrogenase family protein subunit M [Desulfomonile sp.]|nr:xanthine dehydrogenase family protein subunit M [Desulfomonile sp.]
MRTFEYLKPTSLKEALELLERYGEKAKLVAGGTDVMVLWKKRAISPEYLISLRNVPELNFVAYDGGLKIGAATPLRTIELSPEIREHFPVITDAVSNLGSVQVRNSGTMGGNICNAAPSADSAPPMLVLGAKVAISGPDGERSVPITEFFRGPSKTVVGPREIVTHFSVPRPQPNTGAAYWKHTRRKAMDLPILGVACLISFQDDMKTCSAASIALGVAAPTPMRAYKAEAFLAGKIIDEATLDEAGAIAASEGSPRTTIRGSAWYRTEMIRVLVKRTGMMCRDRAKGAAGR